MPPIVGPIETVPLPGGSEAPLYLLRFDKGGVLTSPRTLEHLSSSVTADPPTHVFLFSHGWNNDFDTALERYRGFIEGFARQRHQHNLPTPPGYRPVLVGIIWPSTSMVLPWEQGPQIAATAEDDATVRTVVEDVAGGLAEDARERFYALADRSSLDESEADEFGALLTAVTGAGDQDIGADQQPSLHAFLDAWAEIESEHAPPPQVLDENPADFGMPAATGSVPGEPSAAGFGRFDPRTALRMVTVWRMKDRAGTVGARGVALVLSRIQQACDAHVHLLGHSYGARVVLAAISHPQQAELARNVRSMLLLQPAVSHLCFSPSLLDHPDRSGGFRVALKRTDLPIIATFSEHDSALRKVFHLALRRDRDLGEVRIAGPGEPPSRFAALGGWGPRLHGPDGNDTGEARLIDVLEPDLRYDLATGRGPQIYGVDATRTIRGHGDISNASTWWMLQCLVDAE